MQHGFIDEKIEGLKEVGKTRMQLIIKREDEISETLDEVQDKEMFKEWFQK